MKKSLFSNNFSGFINKNLLFLPWREIQQKKDPP
nr:MAG TPA: hypothetical protein [Caudoviricetes sp.]